MVIIINTIIRNQVIPNLRILTTNTVLNALIILDHSQNK